MQTKSNAMQTTDRTFKKSTLVIYNNTYIRLQSADQFNLREREREKRNMKSQQRNTFQTNPFNSYNSSLLCL